MAKCFSRSQDKTAWNKIAADITAEDKRAHGQNSMWSKQLMDKIALGLNSLDKRAWIQNNHIFQDTKLKEFLHVF